MGRRIQTNAMLMASYLSFLLQRANKLVLKDLE